jgi:hypothetical protein
MICDAWQGPYRLLSRKDYLNNRCACAIATIKLGGVPWSRLGPRGDGFHECLQIRPNDGPFRVLLERIQFLRRNPPGKDWNGVWHLREK